MTDQSTPHIGVWILNLSPTCVAAVDAFIKSAVQSTRNTMPLQHMAREKSRIREGFFLRSRKLVKFLPFPRPPLSPSLSLALSPFSYTVDKYRRPGETWGVRGAADAVATEKHTLRYTCLLASFWWKTSPEKSTRQIYTFTRFSLSLSLSFFRIFLHIHTHTHTSEMIAKKKHRKSRRHFINAMAPHHAGPYDIHFGSGSRLALFVFRIPTSTRYFFSFIFFSCFSHLFSFPFSKNIYAI